MKKTLISSIAAGLMLGAMSAASVAADDDDKNTEKCYGVARAGKNDCAAKGHACAGQSKTDSDGKEWVKLPKGTCERIVGGSTSPK